MRCGGPRWLPGTILVLAVVGGGCESGQVVATPTAARAPETDTTLPMADEGAPDPDAADAEAAVGDEDAESDIELVGVTDVLAVAGEVVEIDHLVRNVAVGSRSATMRTRRVDDALRVELSRSSFRISAGGIVPITSTVTVADTAEVGRVLHYEVVALNVDDIAQRRVSEVRIEVVEATGTRPVAGDDAGTTSTNEKLLVFAAGDDSDADGDLDPASMEIVAGGFLGDQVSAGANGIITYVPFADVTGDDVVLYRICDEESRCDSAVVAVTIDD